MVMTQMRIISKLVQLISKIRDVFEKFRLFNNNQVFCIKIYLKSKYSPKRAKLMSRSVHVQKDEIWPTSRNSREK
jgi:hypothetical protein